ncbi:MAG: DOMON domain-containing protein [Pseudomonadota bacterium]
MNRRHFVLGAGLTFSAIPASASPLQETLSLDGTTFRNWHRKDRLFSTFSAPTKGWLAVGFNNQERLEGTRFVMGAVVGSSFRAEERIALVPNHRRIQDLGLAPAVEHVSGHTSENTTTMQFSMPHVLADSDNPTLSSGKRSYVMLAWSHDTDFEHHSAWRRHFLMEL